ncbi:hypothetical protein DLM46_21395 [Paraburkholderia lacunae]|uniref:Uncharacterized protein n=1 Tax=Paraburkholderia lacunae TaxID=2211104 RepID=A0A370N5N6_9BURK|nr:hypothetical protein DLM46_21395 [Paraburkholderia lacunae]
MSCTQLLLHGAALAALLPAAGSSPNRESSLALMAATVRDVSLAATFAAAPTRLSVCSGTTYTLLRGTMNFFEMASLYFVPNLNFAD